MSHPTNLTKESARIEIREKIDGLPTGPKDEEFTERFTTRELWTVYCFICRHTGEPREIERSDGSGIVLRNRIRELLKEHKAPGSAFTCDGKNLRSQEMQILFAFVNEQASDEPARQPANRRFVGRGMGQQS